MHSLDERTLIGLGHWRACYAHPEDRELCIKVARRGDSPDQNDQNTVAWRNFCNLERRRVPLRHIARCHGRVTTSHGPGLICERIRNTDGGGSKTVDESLERAEIELAQVLAMLAELERWSMTFLVVVSDLRSTNLIVRRQGGRPHLVFIDGLGGRRPGRNFSLRQHVLWLARIKTRRQWRAKGPALYAELDRIRREQDTTG